MRRFVDLVAVLAAVGLIGGLLYLRSEQTREDRVAAQASQELRRFDLAIKLRAITGDGEQLNTRRWPMSVDAEWFDTPPRNPLLSPDRPWVEVAPPDQAHLTDPPVRLAMDSSLASFWYNPYQGVIRARVPLAINDSRSLELYNRVNGTSLRDIYYVPPPPRERPQEPEESAQDPEEFKDATWYLEQILGKADDPARSNDPPTRRSDR